MKYIKEPEQLQQNELKRWVRNNKNNNNKH